MRTTAVERFSTYTLYFSIKGIIPEIVTRHNRIPYYDVTKKAALNKLLYNWPYIFLNQIISEI